MSIPFSYFTLLPESDSWDPSHLSVLSSVVVIQYLGKCNLREKGFVWLTGPGYSLSGGLPQQLELVPLHPQSRRAMDACNFLSLLK